MAGRLGVSHATYLNWETGKSAPETRSYPAVIDFLGYDPSAEPQTFGERIAAARRRQGLTQRELGLQLGLDPTTVWAWETDQVVKPYPRIARIFEEFVEGVE